MSAKDKYGMNGQFERTVEFLGDALSNKQTTRKIWKLNTCGHKADTETDENEPEGGHVTNKFTIDVFCF